MNKDKMFIDDLLLQVESSIEDIYKRVNHDDSIITQCVGTRILATDGVVNSDRLQALSDISSCLVSAIKLFIDNKIYESTTNNKGKLYINITNFRIEYERVPYDSSEALDEALDIACFIDVGIEVKDSSDIKINKGE